MCTQRRYITNALGRQVLVNCGHCPSCLQEKAVARTNRIRNNQTSGLMRLFFHLTYRNCCAPYFDALELSTTEPQLHWVYDKHGDRVLESFKCVPVYRDVSCKRVRRGRSYRFGFKDFRKREQLGSIVLRYPLCDRTHFKYLVNSHSTHVSVCYYPDVQNFIKNLRQYVKRHFGNEVNFSFYTCSEYGPNTCRAHFHGLLDVPVGDLSMWKKAIASCWPYDNHRLTSHYIEIAVDAAAYVSSYVNCDTSVPEVLANNPDFKPKHSFSQGYGLGLEHLSLVKVFEAYRRGDLTCRVSRIRKGTLVVDDILLPKYVISRYFPKIKGYSRLNADALEFICERPAGLARYSRELGYSQADLKSNISRLRHAKSLAFAAGIDPIEYSFAYSRVWSLRSSQVLKSLYNSVVSVFDYFQLYDNISDYFSARVLSPTLDDFMFLFPDDYHFEVDYNKFSSIVEKTNVMTQAYYSYSKDRKIRNDYYSRHGYFKNRV